MKKLFLTALSLLCLLGATELKAQNNGEDSPNFPKLDASPLDIALYRNQNDEAVARVIYSRPQKRDREIFGKLVPYGQVWRTGANEATELTLYKDLEMAGEKIDAGTYSLYTIPEEKEWTVILNKKTLTWGAYEYTDKEDLVRIKVPVRDSKTTIEDLSMAFQSEENGADLLIGWDDKYVEVPFTEAE